MVEKGLAGVGGSPDGERLDRRENLLEEKIGGGE